MKQKLSVSEFAALVGTTAKTIYERINKNSNLPVNEQLETVNEKVKGREVILILTDQPQIDFYKNIYGKDTVINGEYYEKLTDNNGLNTLNNVSNNVKSNNDNTFSPDLFERLTTLNNEYNNRLDTVRNELFTTQKQLLESEKRTLLLEDKAGREGYYLNEISERDKEIKKQKTVITWLITVSVVLLIVIITAATYLLTVNYAQKSVNINLPEPAANQEIIKNE